MKVNGEELLIHDRCQCDSCGNNDRCVQVFTGPEDVDGVALCLMCLEEACRELALGYPETAKTPGTAE